MQICGLSLTPTETAALVGIGLTIVSEAIAASPLKENSIIQIGMSLLKGYTRRIGADTPKLSGQKAPSAASPAPRRRGRPRKTKPSSQS
jgi:hypothetical protein